ncbi:PE-PPE domain-containing protein, partial [Mycobacterium sp. E3339]|uniref:PE-PPE domain-containing protein n=1 Tax=Mycobacterium sp. E3339 TaxID=1834146 RepID=UPI0012E959EB
ETFGKSVYQGMATLNSAILTQTAAGNHVVVVGYSQSATIASLEMRYLQALPAAVCVRIAEFSVAMPW